MKIFFGLCIGASGISIAKIAVTGGNSYRLDSFKNISHGGFPRETARKLLDEFNAYGSPIVFTGRKFRKNIKTVSIPEPVAVESVLDHFFRGTKDLSAVASLGGETFMVYSLDEEAHISNVFTKNQCASGTGEFFLQQIKRMNISIDETTSLALDAEPFKVSGRCSVFCKSDCTHALNKGIPKSEVAAGLCRMIAEKADELLVKIKSGKILAVGGVTQNEVVMKFIREKYPELIIPEFSASFEAVGAALYGMKSDAPAINSFEEIFNENESSFAFHKPLANFLDLVSFRDMQRGTPKVGESCILGLDVGSTTTKAVVISEEKAEILASVYLYTNGDPIAASRACYSSLKEQLPTDIRIIAVGVTGSGRQIAGLHAITDGVINEIVAHANAAVFFDPEVETIFEIGGQDAKYTYIVNKVAADYAMNEACSAGTGSFIEESAYESLGIKVTDIEPIAFEGQNPPNFSDQCAAFIMSDIKTALQENLSREDIVAGLVYSICLNYVNRVKGNRPVGRKIFMQGGVCYNRAIPVAMAALTGRQIIVPPEPGLMGAFGVALGVREKISLGIMEPSHYDLEVLANREVSYQKPFTCLGGKEECDRRCTINILKVEGKRYPFGGACNKYYNLKNDSYFDYEQFDYVKRRRELMFNKFAPKKEFRGNEVKIGINASFNTFTLFPLFYNFFTELGFEVIIPDEPDESSIELTDTAFCFPAQLSHAMFGSLMKMKPDYVFLPQIYEMFTENSAEHRLDFDCSCVFVSGEPMYLKQSFRQLHLNGEILSPQLNFAKGWYDGYGKMAESARKAGVKDNNLIRDAYEKAVQIQKDYESEMLELGRDALASIDDDPETFAVVLIGRPYNTFMDQANKGIPQKFSTRGIPVIPFDMLDYHDEKIDDNMYWESGKKILKAAKLIKENDKLFAVYVSNFSCAPDSMIMTTFRDIMGSKPSLTLELDGHTADAGLNTRIDAAIDIIKNYRKLNLDKIVIKKEKFQSAEVVISEGESFFISSDGEKVSLRDERVIILVPSMGDLASKLFAAGIRSIGFNAVAAKVPDAETLKIGRAQASGKECLPLLIMVGSLMQFIETSAAKDKFVVFFTVQGAGNCRLGQYPVFIRHIIKSGKIRNLAQMTLMNEDGFAGFGKDFALRGIQAVIASDVLEDVRSGILANAVNPESGEIIFDREFEKFCLDFEKNPKSIYKNLTVFAKKINEEIPSKRNILDSKYIALLGEIYVRRDGFSHKWLNRYFAKSGFIVKDAYISEWIMYVDYLLKIDLLEPEKSIRKRLERNIRYFFMRDTEKKIKKALAYSGYYEYKLNEIKPLLDHSKHLVPLEFKGEPGLTLGTALHEGLEKYCGLINIGPFGCMPTRFTEAVAAGEMKVSGKIEAKRITNPGFTMSKVFNGSNPIPFLTIETDGNVYPQVIEARLETFLLQAERAAELIKNAKLKNEFVKI